MKKHEINQFFKKISDFYFIFHEYISLQSCNTNNKKNSNIYIYIIYVKVKNNYKKLKNMINTNFLWRF